MVALGMPGYTPSSYGDGFADVYDEWYPGFTDVDETVAFIDGLTIVSVPEPGRILELGVGTGRLAIPLSRHHHVTGLDVSEAMLDKLGAADTDGQVTVVRGDMSNAADYPDGPFDAVVVAYNSLFMLTEPGQQAACFDAVASVLAPDGAFVVEAFVPLDPPPSGSDIAIRSMTADRVVLALSVSDPISQQIDGQFVELVDGRSVRLRPWRIRYSTPAQLDEMAAAAGLDRMLRYEDVAKTPFHAGSERHVTVYRRG